MTQLDDVRKYRVIDVGAQSAPDSLEPIGLVKPDGTPFGGGGSSPLGVLGAHYSGTFNVPDNGSSSRLPFSSASGTHANILNRTVPATPTATIAGLYMVTCKINVNDQHSGELFAELDLDDSGDDPFVSATTPMGNTGGYKAQLCLAVSYYVPVGGEIVIRVAQNSGGPIDISHYTNIALIPAILG